MFRVGLQRGASLVVAPILADNYLYALCTANGGVAVVDPGGVPETAEWDEVNKAVKAVLVTHHHHDHVDELRSVLAHASIKRPPVVVSSAAALRVPCSSSHLSLEPGSTKVDIPGLGPDAAVDVIATPGHTRDHCAFHFPQLGVVFSGDNLFGLGCGRVFEGSIAEMHASLQSLAKLPDHTVVAGSHEYTLANLEFCLSLGDELYSYLPGSPDDAKAAFDARAADIRTAAAAGKPTMPTTIGLEKATNPFLVPDLSSFARVRAAKDVF
ncbi:hydroxyacylglutathione hydrolase [Thecamonas trahens ATCC 50062]|uniref:hydroxyacylglutathione hydrolase n=1 Tax=Thecamonas trahens ATCC 50062 TaxID=461836 RepID=A0A0L0DHQ6_THETB|nr:hydroxyacylglutathione hydrolase [Thecamonas trahens ATCC 50062]KNC51904.1 hydroxyacylglutathione hydrolase [Thecamonas trahens ATCC 50062]|eukprot:XP_013755760.1 hydroxyacylglutathione hydrolase [Thecamonas trahens ATCC 50062]